MKDILKVMKLDFLTARPLAWKAYILIGIFTFACGLLFSPVAGAYIEIGAMMFVIPLQTVADKSNFNKLYGILPVKRRNIARARFIYIFGVFFFTELLAVALGMISLRLKLYRLMPKQDGEIMQMLRNAFEDPASSFALVFGLVAMLMLMFTYMEMMGQLFGRENEMRVLIITLGVLSVLTVIFITLSNYDIIPTINLPSLPSTLGKTMIMGAVMNAVLFAISVLFGEITANKLAKREL